MQVDLASQLFSISNNALFDTDLHSQHSNLSGNCDTAVVITRSFKSSASIDGAYPFGFSHFMCFIIFNDSVHIKFSFLW